MKEKILTLPSPFGSDLELYKNIWGKSDEPLSIVSGLQGDHLNGLFLNSHLTQFLDSIVEGLDPNYTLTGQVQTFPVVNANAVRSGSRLWPFDGMDMDLAFPGNPDGETAEAQWSREQRIDLLLTDVVLPGGMTGPNIAAAACQARPRLRVLYMSGYTDDAITKHGVAEADIGFLKKPFTVGELGQKIRQALHG